MNILQILVLFPVVYLSAKIAAKSSAPFFYALFTFSMLSLALEDLYWIAFDILRPDSKMPFAADEIAGSAVVLLLASASGELLSDSTKRRIGLRELLFSALFTAANMTLWYAWSGEWFQDFVFGLPYVYLLYTLTRGIKSTGVFDKRSSLFAPAVSSLVILLHFGVLFTAPPVSGLLDAVNYVLMFASCIALFVKAAGDVRQEREGAVFSAFLMFFWSRIVIYMCTGTIYNMALFVNILTLPLMFFAVRGCRRHEPGEHTELLENTAG